MGSTCIDLEYEGTLDVFWIDNADGTRGDAYVRETEEYLGQLSQSANGAFVIDWSDGERWPCTVVGDVLTLCAS